MCSGSGREEGGGYNYKAGSTAQQHARGYSVRHTWRCRLHAAAGPTQLHPSFPCPLLLPTSPFQKAHCRPQGQSGAPSW